MSKDRKTSRRNFLKKAGASAAMLGGAGIFSNARAEVKSGEFVKVLTTDGKLVEVDRSAIRSADVPKPVSLDTKELKARALKGLTNRKFVMVIDLSRCKNARKCVEACQAGHKLPRDHEWIKIHLLQDAKHTSPYWFPKPCFHCDNPMCVSVCPVGATYKRDDGIVLVDNERCIGCKFCMTGCPYSVRVFNWDDPEVDVPEDYPYDPETNIPAREGTVGKCVFCADKLRIGELPRCVKACPMGVIFFGDLTEDTVTNGNETLRFSTLITENAGYRYREELGTHPSVYYLPPVKRLFPVDRGLDGYNDSIKNRYDDVLDIEDDK